VGLVGGVVLSPVWFFGGVAGCVDARGATQSVYFQAGIVGEDDFLGYQAAIVLGFLASVSLEGQAIFDCDRKGREVWDGFYFDSVRLGRTREVTQFAGIRGGDEDVFHALGVRPSALDSR